MTAMTPTNQHTTGRILVVDDEPSIVDAVATALRYEGYEVEEASNGRDALAAVTREEPDLVVLDWMLPDIPGIEVGKRMRERGFKTAILFLTAKDAVEDKVEALRAGGDDYVTKPFSPRELAARVRSVLRRTGSTGAAVAALRFGDVELERETRDVRRKGSLIRLTAKEFDLLWFLASHPRRVFSRDELMASVWGYTSTFDTGTVTVHVRRLREKIEDDPARPRLISTVWGVGYRFDMPVEDGAAGAA